MVLRDPKIVELLFGVVKEAQLKFRHCIVNLVEKHNIISELLTNFHQNLSKYVSINKSTIAQKGSTSVPITASEDKRIITATFAIKLSGTFIPMQLNYSGKTNMSLLKLKFPKTFYNQK